jgi:hypothetical protein
MKIYRTTVSDLLWEVLSKLMTFEELKSFRLVGGTSLSLLLGHRISVDIDLFTDEEYDSIDFEIIDKLFQDSFKCVIMGYGGNNSMGKSYYVGNNEDEVIKVDMFYTDKFAFPIVKYKKIRLSQLEEIAAMKLEIVGHNGRKKDFWDLHELLEQFSWIEMFEFYHKRYPYGHTSEELISKLTDFNEADSNFDPICLRNKYWELIKLDIEETLKS